MSESRARFSVSNPSPASVSFAAFLAAHPETSELGITAAQAEAVRRYFSEWQQGSDRVAERQAEKEALKAARAENLRKQEAKKIEAAKKLLEAAGIEIAS